MCWRVCEVCLANSLLYCVRDPPGGANQLTNVYLTPCRNTVKASGIILAKGKFGSAESGRALEFDRAFV